MDPLLLIAKGAYVAEVIEVCRAQGKYDPKGILNDSFPNCPTHVLGVPVLGTTAKLEEMKAAGYERVHLAFWAWGSGLVRSKLYEKVLDMGFLTPRLIHPSAYVAPSASIGRGTCLMPRAMVGTEALIGENAILNLGSLVEHNAYLGNHVHVASGAIIGGNVRVGNDALVGMGANVLPKLKLGNYAKVGAGAVVTHDVRPGATVVGVPAREVDEDDE